MKAIVPLLALILAVGVSADTAFIPAGGLHLGIPADKAIAIEFLWHRV